MVPRILDLSCDTICKVNQVNFYNLERIPKRHTHKRAMAKRAAESALGNRDSFRGELDRIKADTINTASAVSQ